MTNPGGADDRGGARLARARDLLSLRGLGALLISDLLNIRYLCGFTGSNGLLLVLPGRAVFFTDSRYTLQAREEVQGAEVVEAPELDPAGGEAVRTASITRLGVEEKSLPVARWRKLGGLLPDAELEDVSESLDALRWSKDAGELQRLRDAAQLAEGALRAVLPKLRPGVSEAEVALAYQVEALRLGADALSFDTIVAGGPRAALPHAHPGGRRFERGDLVIVDFGVRLAGYCSDETVTVPVGRVEEEARRVYDTVCRAQQAALALVGPGVRLVEVDRAARQVIAEAGYAERFGHGTGHGVGLAVHEAPTVSTRSNDSAEAGMVFTVEPGIYLPERFGVRLEDTIYVTSGGPERVTAVPKEFGAVWDWAARG
ncbi:MAG: aminopeptidase P family protein [Deltaproteobacteria bacterium]|nr:aminopeptidase P family protein [Deltaproteobacteria bacterium]